MTNRMEEVCFQVLHRQLQNTLSFLPGEGSQDPAECCEGQDSKHSGLSRLLAFKGTEVYAISGV